MVIVMVKMMIMMMIDIMGVDMTMNDDGDDCDDD